MNYIYDIVLNFQKNYYNFFEWKKDDKLKNYSQLPLYRVEDEDMLCLKNNIIKIDKETLKLICSNIKNPQKIICIVSNAKFAMGLLFDQEGNLLKKSSLLFDEEEEAMDLSKNLKSINFKYSKNIHKKVENKLRIEKEKKDLILNYIKNTTSKSTLKYLYYEYFEKELDNINMIKESLINEFSKEWTSKKSELYNIIHILSKTN